MHLCRCLSFYHHIVWDLYPVYKCRQRDPKLHLYFCLRLHKYMVWELFAVYECWQDLSVYLCRCSRLRLSS